jgi:hypothetical protein
MMVYRVVVVAQVAQMAHLMVLNGAQPLSVVHTVEVEECIHTLVDLDFQDLMERYV